MRPSPLSLIVKAVVCLVALAPVAVAAEPPFRLGLPVACLLGKSCWIVNLVDLDPGPGVTDYQCQRQSYNGHKGTDFAIRDLKVMKQGVRVVASADGVVRATRDGVADWQGASGHGTVRRGQECGNGVVIDHGTGWETQYCHLRNGSVAVKPGAQVKRGQVIGLVGQSGLAAFPHVHLAVRHDGRTIDPFVGLEPAAACEFGKHSLWRKSLHPALRQPLTAIYNAGFADVAPKLPSVRQGHHHDPAFLNRAPALVLWASIFNIRKGDLVRMRILSPDGTELHSYEQIMEKTQARRFLYSGRKRRQLVWPAGRYRGEISVIRKLADGTELAIRAQRAVLVR